MVLAFKEDAHPRFGSREEASSCSLSLEFSCHLHPGGPTGDWTPRGSAHRLASEHLAHSTRTECSPKCNREIFSLSDSFPTAFKPLSDCSQTAFQTAFQAAFQKASCLQTTNRTACFLAPYDSLPLAIHALAANWLYKSRKKSWFFLFNSSSIIPVLPTFIHLLYEDTTIYRLLLEASGTVLSRCYYDLCFFAFSF